MKHVVGAGENVTGTVARYIRNSGRYTAKVTEVKANAITATMPQLAAY